MPLLGRELITCACFSILPLGNDMLMAKQPFPSEALRPRHGTGIHGQCSRTWPEITPSRAFTSRVRRLQVHLVAKKWRGDVDM